MRPQKASCCRREGADAQSVGNTMTDRLRDDYIRIDEHLHDQL